MPVPLPPAPAGCDPGADGLDLSECLYLNNETGTTVGATYDEPTDILNVVVKNLFPLAGLLLFFAILLSGFKFVSQGAKGKDEAKQIFTAAIIGFIIMFSAYWIVQLVKVITGTNIVL